MTPPVSIKALLEAEAKATPGPWQGTYWKNGQQDHHHGIDCAAPYRMRGRFVGWLRDSPHMGETEAIANQALIAAARNAVRPLCEALQEAIAALEEIQAIPYHKRTEERAAAALAKIREKVQP